MADLVPNVIVRAGGAEKLRAKCRVTRDSDLADHIGVTAAQVSRVLSNPLGRRSYKPGNQFIAGVVNCGGPEWAFREVFAITMEQR